MLSIVIPTLNEEKYLPPLLQSIRRQNFSDYEIIIADADSQDKTAEIAQKYGCRVVKGGTPGQGKNAGAKAARGELLLFLDADVVLPEDFLGKGLKEFKEKKLNIATFCLLPLQQRKLHQSLFDIFYNQPIVFLEKILPHSATGILIEKEIFQKMNGFDENVKLAEDHDLSRRIIKKGKYGVLRSTRLLVSERRFEEDGWFRTALKYFLCECHMIFLGPVKSDIFKYKFNHYSKNKK